LFELDGGHLNQGFSLTQLDSEAKDAAMISLAGLRTLSSSYTALRLGPNRLLSTMSEALIPPIKSLVSASTENYGSNDADKKDIDSWLNKIAQGEINQSTDLKVSHPSVSLFGIYG
jgi:hypothetical protein